MNENNAIDGVINNQAMEESKEFQEVVNYMKSHWPSQAKPEWQVAMGEYPALLKNALQDLTKNATKNARLIRIAGLSGSGKTTQILPAVKAYCEKENLKPILTAARIFVEYHPHYQEILDFYGEENLRKMTDEFTTIMLFLTLKALTEQGYDIVLDVTFLDPKIEGILQKFLKKKSYQSLILMIATSPTVTEHFLSDRKWRHTKKTEEEFIRATELALKFYAEKVPETRIILWSVYDQPPVYDGPVKNCLPTFEKYSTLTTLPQPDDDLRRQAKVDYLSREL